MLLQHNQQACSAKNLKKIDLTIVLKFQDKKHSLNISDNLMNYAEIESLKDAQEKYLKQCHQQIIQMTSEIMLKNASKNLLIAWTGL
jgi:hypothetical protein